VSTSQIVQSRPEERPPPVRHNSATEDDIDSELSPDKFDDDSFVSKDKLNKDEGEQSNAVSGGWHGRNVMPADYDPMADCLISTDSQQLQRHLYCPALVGENGLFKHFCCGTVETRYCCTAQDWESLHNSNQQEDGGDIIQREAVKQITMEDVIRQNYNGRDEEDKTVEEIGEEIIDDLHDLSNSLPAWAQGLIIAACIILACIIVYCLFSCIVKVACCSFRLLCCCCCKKDKHDEEKAVLVREVHHHSQPSTNPYYGGTTTVYMKPEEGVPLYTNVTDKRKIYPSLS